MTPAFFVGVAGFVLGIACTILWRYWAAVISGRQS